MLLVHHQRFVEETSPFTHDRGRGGKTKIRESTGLELAKSHRAVENREKRRKLVAKSSVVT